MNIHRGYRKSVACAVLGAWLLALFVSMAHACDTMPVAPGEPRMAGMAGAHHDDAAPSPDCRRFCNDDLPLFGKLRLVQDPPAGEPLLIATATRLELTSPMAARVSLPAPRAPPDIPILLRSLRLAL
jgi:hypothetical protein